MSHRFDALLRVAIKYQASDLHLTTALPPMMRVDGELTPIPDYEKCLPSDVQEMVGELLDSKHLAALEQAGQVDFAYSVPGAGRFRLNVFKQRGTLALAGRLLNREIPTPDALGLPDALVAMCEKKRGMVLVTGPTGSGKSTTLASLVNVINHSRSCHVLTLEDPIEYLHRHDKSIVNQREMGSDSASYADALRAALREDPDVILVGEMRDLETISIAVTAAETGHLVFSTLHTVGAANTIDRIIDVFPPYQQQQIRTQLADVLECVVSQQLIPHANGVGRVAAMEVMVANPAIRAHIREAKTFQIPTVMQTNRKLGMITMDDALLNLYNAGEISYDYALSFAQDPTALKKRLY